MSLLGGGGCVVGGGVGQGPVQGGCMVGPHPYWTDRHD